MSEFENISKIDQVIFLAEDEVSYGGRLMDIDEAFDILYRKYDCA